MPLDDLDTATDPALLDGEAPPEDAEATAKLAAAEDAEAAKAEEAAKERDQHIPRARFDEVNTKLHEERDARTALEAKLNAIEAAKTAQNVDINALEKQYTTALMGGEEDKAAALRAAINGELIRQATEQAYTRADQSAQQRESNRDYANAYAKVVEDHPFLDIEGGNTEAIADVMAVRDTYFAQGMPAARALTKAVELMVKVYANEAVTEAGGDPVTDTRLAAAVARNAADARRQPPSMSQVGVGNRAVPIPPAPQSQAEYEALPEAERKKLLE